MTDDRDILDQAREWLESWPGPLKLVGGSRAQQSVPDAHNAAPELVREMAEEIGLQRAQLAVCRDQYNRVVAENERLRESASHWEGLWRQDLETAATALRERDEALAEMERLRGNQRVEVVEDWHGLAKGSD